MKTKEIESEQKSIDESEPVYGRCPNCGFSLEGASANHIRVTAKGLVIRCPGCQTVIGRVPFSEARQ